jgi:Holliday junction resolvasome RuvABC endonuclease subunit
MPSNTPGQGPVGRASRNAFRTVGPIREADLFRAFDAIAYTLKGERAAMEDAVVAMNPDAAAHLWTALGAVRDLIEDTDGEAEGRPWHG